MSADTIYIDLGYKPRPWQSIIHRSNARLRAVVGARQIGLTEMGLMELVDRALRVTDGPRVFAHVSPTKKLAKIGSFDKAKRVFLPLIERELVVPNEAQGVLCFRLGSGDAYVYFTGADDECEHRGRTYAGVVVDDADAVATAFFTEVIAPALLPHQGWALLTGTPYEKPGLLHEVVHNKTGGWECWHFPVDAVDVFSGKIIEQIKQNRSKECFEREFMARWTQE